jgi:hypothetical protein
MLVRLYGLVVAELEEAVDFFATREEADAALEAVRDGEPAWIDQVRIQEVAFDVRVQ